MEIRSQFRLTGLALGVQFPITIFLCVLLAFLSTGWKYQLSQAQTVSSVKGDYSMMKVIYTSRLLLADVIQVLSVNIVAGAVLA